LKILVTGDRGYIGTVMVPYLQRLGHQITGLDTEYYYDGDLTPPPSGYTCIRKDVRDVTGDDLEGFEAVIHLAALSNDPLGDLKPELTYEINYHASVRLAELARETGVRRFLYASSCSLYGAAGDQTLKEDSPLRPLTPYAESKVRTEEALSKLASGSFAPVYLRSATVYGVSPRLRLDIVLNNLAGWAVTVGKIRIMSDGSPWRPILHVQDIAQAFACVLEGPAELVSDQAFNVGANSENYQVRDLAAIVQQVAPACSVEYSGKASPDPRNYRVDFSKLARTFPAFRPRWTALEGARELYGAYRAAGMSLEDFQDRKFTRLKHLRYLLETRRLDDSLRWTKVPLYL
jgi:nucleoside-diphosphate-sugar epimerase